MILNGNDNHAALKLQETLLETLQYTTDILSDILSPLITRITQRWAMDGGNGGWSGEISILYLRPKILAF